MTLSHHLRISSAARRLSGGALLVACALSAFAAPANAAGSSWEKGAKSSARLISAGGLQEGRYTLGVEIVLDRNALTYWRSPGDAGVPPIFNFDASANVADAKVLYPAPGRYMEGGSTAYGYRDRVVFPLEIAPKDAAAPTMVDVDLNYAVCDNICIPAQAHLRIDLRPDASRSADAADIEAFAAKVPRPMTVSVTPRYNLWGVAGAAKPTWRIKLAAPPSPASDLFAEGPEGWYFDTVRSGESTFDIILAEKPPKASLPIDNVVLTVNEGDRAFEATTRLDAPPPKP